MPDTIAALATPPGGALGVLRLSGPRAKEAALRLLRLGELEPRRAAFAVAQAGGEAVDEVVAVYFPGPRSATGEDLVEVTAHGSAYVLARLLEAALDAGCRQAEPGEFTRRAFVNGRLDLAQAEAVGRLIAARGAASHRAALSQLQGGLSRAVAAARAPVLELLARVEASLDHPEEDLPSLGAEELDAAVAAAAAPIERLVKEAERGRLLADGARVAIVGRPNAGKSSLLNALLGAERSIVCAEPGTTRDTIEEPAAIEGIPAVLVDTAGLRDGEEGGLPRAESLGLERAERALDSCDLALLVIDGSRAPEALDERARGRVLESAARAGRPVVTVLNKSDLGLRRRLDGALPVSARDGSGLAALRRALAERLGAEAGEPPTLCVGARHREALRRAAAELAAARGAARRWPHAWEERAAAHLRACLGALGGIVGEGTPEEVLDEIFSRFCIGK